MLVLYLLYWFDIQSTKQQAYASCTQQYLCFSLAVVFNYRLSDVNSCNYTTTDFHALVLLWKCVLHWGGAEPLWGGCILPRIMSSQCSGIPWGFPSDLTSHPSSNSNSREEKGFVIWLPASLCFLRSEAELWFIVKFPQARSISRPTESLNGGNCSPREWPFLGWSLPRPEQGLIKVISFFFFPPAMSSIASCSRLVIRVQWGFCCASVCGLETMIRWCKMTLKMYMHPTSLPNLQG